MTVFIFGAGSTYGTLGNFPKYPPLARDFGKRLRRESCPNLVKVAKHLGKDLAKVGLVDMWSTVDYFAKFMEARGGFLAAPEWLTGAVWELKRAILSM